MATPTQMFDHALNILKGPAANLDRISFTNTMSSNVTIDPVYRGRVVHNTANGFEMGAVGKTMPLFLLKSTNDLDVDNAAGTVWYPVQPTGNLTAVSATSGYELQSTEFDTAQTYVENEHLRGVDDNTGSTGGRITNQSMGALYDHDANTMEAVVGVVSRPAATDHHGVSRLSFWAYHLPGLAS